MIIPLLDIDILTADSAIDAHCAVTGMCLLFYALESSLYLISVGDHHSIIIYE